MTKKEKPLTNSNLSTPAFDADRYKDGQRQEWNKVAAGWTKWWALFEQGAHTLSKRLVALANLQPGQQVLDVATGIGEPATIAAHRVGSTGHVIGIDQSSEMLAIARQRAAAQGLEQTKYMEMDAESLDFPQSSFDAVLCRLGLMFLPNLDAALQQMRQLLKPGGYLATAVWDVPSQVPMLSLPMRIARQQFQLPPPPAGVPNPFNLADVAAFEQRLRQAGFTEITSERITLIWQFASADEFVSMTRDLAAPITALLASQPAEWQAAVWNAIAEAVEQYAGPNGRICVPSEAICVIGQRH